MLHLHQETYVELKLSERHETGYLVTYLQEKEYGTDG